MTRIGLLATAAILAATPALADSVHFKPPSSGPDFIDNGLTLTAFGSLAGLGNEDIAVFLSATANATATCTNPGSSQNQPPGQNPAPVTVTGSEAIPASEIKNGNVDFSVTTQAPTNPIPGAPGCPNPNWTETITDLSFTTASVTIDQPSGTFVLGAQCVFSPPTQNGPVSRQTVSCSIQQ